MSTQTTSMTTGELQRLLCLHAQDVREVVEHRIPGSLRNQISTDDILQETWIAAFRTSINFVSDRPNAFRRWVVTIAQSKVTDAIRGAHRAKHGGPIGAEDRAEPLSALFQRVTAGGRTPSRETSAREAADAISIAISGLPEDRQRALSLRHIHGHSPSQIARLMNKSVAAVNSLLFHGLRQLRERLGEAGRYLSGDQIPAEPT